MKQLKSVEIFADVICQNCISYNQCRCYEELPAIPTEPGNRCGQGNWLFNEEIINYRHCCFELLPFIFVTSVEDLICNNCSYYDSSREECHYFREHIYKSAEDNWCNSGVWFYRDADNEVILGSLSDSYEKLIKGNDTQEK